MRIEYSPDHQLLYLRLRAGSVAETVELEQDVLMDFDHAGEPLGLEFLEAREFLPFLFRLVRDADGRTLMDLPDDLITALKQSRQAAVA